MSADRQRLKNAIRAIALTPEERRALLGDSSNKGGKASSAGVGTSEAEESRLCCDGSTSGSANPGAQERDPGADGAGQDGGLDGSDPAKLDMGAGTLSGVTDCATGEPVCFNGSGFIPPEGWDDIDSQPFAEGYEAGFFHRLTREYEPDLYGPTPQSVASQVFSGAIAIPGGDCDRGTTPSCSTPYAVSYSKNSPIGYGYCIGCISKVGCPEDSTESYCNPSEEEIRELKWPEDGCTNLAIKGGKIVGSKYDPENDGSYSAPRDSIDLCDPENGARITLRASGQSDWKTIDAINGGDGYLYSGGKQIARVSGDEFTDPNV